MDNKIILSGKEYEIPKFTFGEIKKLEKLGFIFSKIDEYLFNNYTALIRLVVDCDEETADKIIIDNADTFDISIEKLLSALSESSFFQKMANKKAQTQKVTK